jgi:hypothetical protein
MEEGFVKVVQGKNYVMEEKNVKRSTLGNMKRKVLPLTTPNVELDDHVETTLNCDGGFSIGEASVLVMLSSF